MKQIGFIRVRKLPMLLAVLLTTSTSILNAETPSAVKINTINCGNLLDGIADEPNGPRILTISNGVITSIAQPSELHTVDLDLSDYTCLPGLINTHVHFDANPEDAADYGVYARRTSEDNLQLILRNAETTLRSGFTTVRHAGSWFPDTLMKARAEIEAGRALGPRIQSAGPYLTIPGGGGDLTFPEIPPNKIPTESQQGIATTPKEFAERASTAIDKGADFLKVIASGAVFSTGTEPGAPEMHQDDIEAVVRVAKQRGVKVTAHVHSDQSGRDAILAGVDSLEHASLLSDETIALASRTMLRCRWMSTMGLTPIPLDANRAIPRFLSSGILRLLRHSALSSKKQSPQVRRFSTARTQGYYLTTWGVGSSRLWSSTV